MAIRAYCCYSKLSLDILRDYHAQAKASPSVALAGIRSSHCCTHEQHPWLARQIVEPAPGHLPVVAHLFAQVEYLLPPAVLARKGSLSVSCNRDRLAIHYQPPRPHSERAAAVFDLIAQTKHLSLQKCPVCGVQIVGDGIRPKRCPQHDGIQGLFAEEVRRSRQLIVEQGYSRWCTIWAR